jgi:hypothetical protein
MQTGVFSARFTRIYAAANNHMYYNAKWRCLLPYPLDERSVLHIDGICNLFAVRLLMVCQKFPTKWRRTIYFRRRNAHSHIFLA